MFLRISCLLILSACAVVGQTVVHASFQPPVIVAGKTKTVIFQVRTQGAPIVTRCFFGEREMQQISSNLFSIELDAAQIASSTKPEDVSRPYLGTFRLVNGSTTIGPYIVVAEVAGPDIPRTRVTPVGLDAQYTDHLVNIRFPAFFPSDATPTTWPDPAPLVRRFYQMFGDNYDQLNIVNIPAYYQNRYHFTVRTDATGTGQSSQNNTAAYGSAGALLGINRFPLTSYFDAGETAFVHEFAHQWINFLSTGSASGGVPHWPISSLASGVMGFSLPTADRAGGNFPCTVTQENNAVRLSPRTLPASFTDVDLYLMGLLDSSEAGKHVIFTDQTDAVLSQCTDKLYTGQYSIVTLKDIIGLAGTRTPGPAASKKAYRVATILVTKDALLNEDEMAFYSYFARRGEERGAIPVRTGAASLTLTNPFHPATGSRATVNLQVTTTPLPRVFYGGVVNGSSGAQATWAAPLISGSVAPGSYVALYGERLAGRTLQASSASLPVEMDGLQVLVNGVAAPLYYISPGQINLQLPFETATGLASVAITHSDGAVSNTAYIKVSAAAPGITVFGNNRAAVLNQDQSVNLAANGAEPGSYATVYFTGIGPLDNPVPSGQPAPLSPLSRSTLSCTLTVGGRAATVTFCGLTPQSTGLAQVNFQVPALTPGDHLIQLTIGGAASNSATVTIR